MNNSERKGINPFYVILVVVGVAFVITACAYFVMALKEVHASSMITEASGDDSLELQGAGSRSFVEFVDRYGVKLMVGELAILGVATVAAIATDSFWSKD